MGGGFGREVAAEGGDSLSGWPWDACLWRLEWTKSA